MKKRTLMLGLLALAFPLVACGNSSSSTPSSSSQATGLTSDPEPSSSASSSASESSPSKEYLTLWNDCSAINALKEYVEDVTDENSENFIPVNDRIVTFDMDGTFVAELYPSYFEYLMLEYRVLDDPTYKDKAPAHVKEVAQEIRDFCRSNKKTALPSHFDMRHAYAAAEAYSGMTLAEFDAYVKEYAKTPANGFKNMTLAESFYKPMLEIFDYLSDNDFEYYVVSGSDRFICRSLVDSLGIEPNHVIGMDVTLKSTLQGDNPGVDYTIKVDETLVRTNELIIKNLKTNKVKQIAQEIGKVPVLSFGNSGGDSAMHNYCLSNKQYRSEAFMLIADDDVRDHADREKGLKLGEDWKKAGYHVISMRDDWKTIYGEKVEKTDFSFAPSPVEEITYDAFVEEVNDLPENTYDGADYSRFYNVTIKQNGVIETDSDNSMSYVANYDSESSSFVIDDESAEAVMQEEFINETADTLNQDGGIFDTSKYQTCNVHYYKDGETYRYRYSASGKYINPATQQEIALVSEGVVVYNEFGYPVIDESFATITIEEAGYFMETTNNIAIKYFSLGE